MSLQKQHVARSLVKVSETRSSAIQKPSIATSAFPNYIVASRSVTESSSARRCLRALLVMTEDLKTSPSFCSSSWAVLRRLVLPLFVLLLGLGDGDSARLKSESEPCSGTCLSASATTCPSIASWNCCCCSGCWWGGYSSADSSDNSSSSSESVSICSIAISSASAFFLSRSCLALNALSCFLTRACLGWASLFVFLIVLSSSYGRFEKNPSSLERYSSSSDSSTYFGLFHLYDF